MSKMKTKGPGDPKKKSGPKTIYTSDPKRVKAYNDSMTLYKTSKSHYDRSKSATSAKEFFSKAYPTESERSKSIKAKADLTSYNNNRAPRYEKEISRNFGSSITVTERTMGIPTGFHFDQGAKFTQGIYKKPVQPVVLAKKAEKKKTTKTSAKVAAPKTTAKAKPISKPVEKAKPVVKKPEKIVMKPVSEEDSSALKAGFKKQTGKEFKSKDSDYNKLEKKLGRKPTVAEYNKSIKKS